MVWNNIMNIDCSASCSPVFVKSTVFNKVIIISNENCTTVIPYCIILKSWIYNLSIFSLSVNCSTPVCIWISIEDLIGNESTIINFCIWINCTYCSTITFSRVAFKSTVYYIIFTGTRIYCSTISITGTISGKWIICNECTTIIINIYCTTLWSSIIVKCIIYYFGIRTINCNCPTVRCFTTLKSTVSDFSVLTFSVNSTSVDNRIIIPYCTVFN